MIKEYAVFFKRELASFAPKYFDDLKDAKLYAEISEIRFGNPESIEVMKVQMVPLAA
jgi:hypothetical protein